MTYLSIKVHGGIYLSIEAIERKREGTNKQYEELKRDTTNVTETYKLKRGNYELDTN